jgi:hypothetical protein
MLPMLRRIVFSRVPNEIRPPRPGPGRPASGIALCYVLRLTAIGYVCMLAGALAIVVSLVLTQQRRSRGHTSTVERRDDLPPTV